MFLFWIWWVRLNGCGCVRLCVFSVRGQRTVVGDALRWINYYSQNWEGDTCAFSQCVLKGKLCGCSHGGHTHTHTHTETRSYTVSVWNNDCRCSLFLSIISQSELLAILGGLVGESLAYALLLTVVCVSVCLCVCVCVCVCVFPTLFFKGIRGLMTPKQKVAPHPTKHTNTHTPLFFPRATCSWQVSPCVYTLHCWGPLSLVQSGTGVGGVFGWSDDLIFHGSKFWVRWHVCWHNYQNYCLDTEARTQELEQKLGCDVAAELRHNF